MVLCPEMDAETFSSAIEELAKAKLEKPKRLMQKASRLWQEISEGTHSYDRKVGDE